MSCGSITTGLPEAIGIAAIGARALWVRHNVRRDQRRWPTLAADLDELADTESPAELETEPAPVEPPADRVVGPPLVDLGAPDRV